MTSFPYRLTTGLAALAASVALSSCANTTKSPDTGVIDYTQPKSKLSHEEYPFDDAGNYREDWAAAGAAGVKDKPTDTAVYTQPSDSGPQNHPAYTPDEPPTRSTSTASRSASTTHRTASTSSRSTASSSSKPKPKPAPPKSTPPKPTMVKVKPGDTLYALSKRSGVSVDAIKAANGLKTDTIVDGKSLKIPKKK